MKSKRYPLITVIGNVGSGKSTVSNFLAKSLNARMVAADELYKTNPFFNDAVVDRSRWSLASDLWFLLKRVEIAKKLDILLQKKTVVQDSGLLMSWAYANSRLNAGHMNQKEADLYNAVSKECTSQLPKEDLIIFLDLPTMTLRKRIIDRGRTFEIQFHTKRYLAGLASSLDILLQQIKTTPTPVLHFTKQNWRDIVNNPDHQDLLVDEVKNMLRKHLYGRTCDSSTF